MSRLMRLRMRLKAFAALMISIGPRSGSAERRRVFAPGPALQGRGERDECASRTLDHRARIERGTAASAGSNVSGRRRRRPDRIRKYQFGCAAQGPIARRRPALIRSLIASFSPERLGS